LDIDAVLREVTDMQCATPNSDALTVLRLILDLAQVDLRPTTDLLGRLCGHDEAVMGALLAQLRRAGLVQMDRLGLTMGGLAIASRQPETEPVRSQPQSPARTAARAA
jgi:hypothetical protein